MKSTLPDGFKQDCTGSLPPSNWNRYAHKYVLMNLLFPSDFQVCSHVAVTLNFLQLCSIGSANSTEMLSEMLIWNLQVDTGSPSQETETDKGTPSPPTSLVALGDGGTTYIFPKNVLFYERLAYFFVVWSFHCRQIVPFS